MISHNKMTGRSRKTCKYEVELTELLGENTTYNHLLYQEGLVLREQMNFNKENNVIVNNIIDVSEIFEDESGSSNRAPIGNIQNLNKDEVQNSTNKIRRNTITTYLSNCQSALNTYISERNNEKQHNKSLQMQIPEEFRNIRKVQEDFVNSSKKQWTTINAKRDEKNIILREIAKGVEQIAKSSFSTSN